MDKLKGLMGLAARAGHVISGTEMALKAVKDGSAALVLLDSGASDNTKKRVTDSCAFYGAALYSLPEGLLDAALGREGRMTATVKKGSFAAPIRKLLTQDDHSSIR